MVVFFSCFLVETDQMIRWLKMAKLEGTRKEYSLFRTNKLRLLREINSVTDNVCFVIILVKKTKCKQCIFVLILFYSCIKIKR